jgi:hypothetical protein
MTNFKVEKGVPIPKPKMGRHTKYPWNEMNIGDSFPVTIKQYLTVRANVGYRNRTYNDKYFILRQCDGKYRVWRIK